MHADLEPFFRPVGARSLARFYGSSVNHVVAKLCAGLGSLSIRRIPSTSLGTSDQISSPTQQSSPISLVVVHPQWSMQIF